MGWNLRDNDRLISEINITPLTDVMLVLLVIFMVTTPLIVMESFKVRLPGAVTSTAEPGTGLVVAVSRAGVVEINGQRVDPADLKGVFTRELAGRADRTVVVKADGEARHAVVVKVLDAARDAGAEKLSIATVKEEDRGR
jgi:biopolymer transport protein ExbD